mmetsp:Transcript_26841/g.22586  ORF Transcript_26841/g.22586 Transcript_26841/m.22586 type:complete len:83 (-) Transcript_26841:273-521(-)
MQHAATYCYALLCDKMLEGLALCCNTLQHSTLRRYARQTRALPQHTAAPATYCSILQHTAPISSATTYSIDSRSAAARCNTL